MHKVVTDLRRVCKLSFHTQLCNCIPKFAGYGKGTVIYMNQNLILYHDEDIENDLLDLIHRVLGPASVQRLKEFRGDLQGVSNLALFLTPYTPSLNKEVVLFFERYKNQILNIRLAITYIFYDGDKSNEETEIRIIQTSNELAAQLGEYFIFFDYIHYNIDCSGEVASKLRALKRKLMDTSDMPPELLEDEITRILRAHNTCTLCTGCNHSLRATPIEYTYNDGNLYFLSEGGEKFTNLSISPKVAVAIYKEYEGFDKLEGVQVEGGATMVELFSKEYDEITTLRGLSSDNLKAMPVRLNMFKVIPERIEVLCSQFKKEGYQAKQVVYMNRGE